MKMNKEDLLKNDINSLKEKLKSDQLKGEKYQLALDMLKTKQDELNALKNKKEIKSVIDAPIAGLQTPKKKTRTDMGGAFII